MIDLVFNATEKARCFPLTGNFQQVGATGRVVLFERKIKSTSLIQHKFK